MEATLEAVEDSDGNFVCNGREGDVGQGCHGGVGNSNAELSNDWPAGQRYGVTVETLSYTAAT